MFSEPYRKEGDYRYYYRVERIKNTPKAESENLMEDMENEIMFTYGDRDYTYREMKEMEDLASRCNEIFRAEKTEELLYKNIPLGTIEKCKEIFDIMKSYREYMRKQNEKRERIEEEKEERCECDKKNRGIPVFLTKITS